MILNTVVRFGDGTARQVFMPIEEDNMKSKCDFCVARHGDAVKTDKLVLVTVKGHDYLACSNCAYQIQGGKSHEPANNQPKCQ